MSTKSFLKPKRLMIDTSVWIAYFAGEQQRQDEVLRLFEACALNEIELLYTPTTVKDVFYLLPRRLRRIDSARGACTSTSYAPYAWGCIRAMGDIATPAPLSLAEYELACMLRKEHGDFEDNLIVAASETCGADALVTYDRELSSHFAPICAMPEELTKLIEALP